jgi:hypothetical protein
MFKAKQQKYGQNLLYLAKIYNSRWSTYQATTLLILIILLNPFKMHWLA